MPSQWEQQSRSSQRAQSALRKTNAFGKSDSSQSVRQPTKRRPTFDPSVNVEDAARAARASVAAEYDLPEPPQHAPDPTSKSKPSPGQFGTTRGMSHRMQDGVASDSEAEAILSRNYYVKVDGASRWTVVPGANRWNHEQRPRGEPPNFPARAKHFAPAEHPSPSNSPATPGFGLRRRAETHPSNPQPHAPTAVRATPQVPTPQMSMLSAAYKSTRNTARRAPRASCQASSEQWPAAGGTTARVSRQQNVVQEKKKRDEIRRLSDSACARLWDPDGDIEMFLRMGSFAGAKSPAKCYSLGVCSLVPVVATRTLPTFQLCFSTTCFLFLILTFKCVYCSPCCCLMNQSV
jgi:hypothetical protein